MLEERTCRELTGATLTPQEKVAVVTNYMTKALAMYIVLKEMMKTEEGRWVLVQLALMMRYGAKPTEFNPE